MPKISVLVPIFNVEQYLRECLDSVVNQTFRDLEIICLNDGSTDGSLAIIEEYARRDRRIVIIDKANSGYGDSMNRGLERASGEFIAIVESDDWVELNMFEDLYRLASSHNAEVVKSNYYTYYADPKRKALSGEKIELVREHETGRIIDPSKNDDIFFQQPAIWSAIYRRSFIEQHGIRFLPSPGASYQDTSFAFKVWSSTHRAVYTSEAYLHYRRDNEASSVNTAGKVFCVAEEYAEIERYITERQADLHIQQIMRVCKWGAYAWNIDRLSADLAPEFIELASREYRDDRAAGRFNFELCDVNQAREIADVMDRPEMVVARKQAQEAARVSVIVPFFNVESYLRSCIESVVGQTFSEIEVILVDDGSVDESSTIAEEYLRNDPRVQLINQRNTGQASARNRGLTLAHAEYVTFIDGDDTYEPDSVELLYSAIVEHEVDFVVGTIRPVFEPGVRSALEKFQDQHYYEVRRSGTHAVDGELLRELDASVCNKIFVREHIENLDISFPDGLRYEDAYFVNAYAMTSTSVFYLRPEQVVYNYVRRPGSTMSSTFSGSSSSKDHLHVAFQLLDVVQDNELEAKFGHFYMWLLRQYEAFAFAHAAEGDSAEIWRMLRHFVSKHHEVLRRMDPYVLGELERHIYPGLLGVLGKVPAVRGVVLQAGSQVRSRVSRLLPKVSIAYRAQQNILGHVGLLRKQVAASNAHLSGELTGQSRKLNDISAKADQILKSENSDTGS